MKQAVSSPDAPKAIGPYSPAVRAGQLLFVSGQVPLDPATGQIVERRHRRADAPRPRQHRRAARGRRACSFADVVRTTVFLADMNDFAAMNEVYGSYFTEPYPARATVQVARLPQGRAHRNRRRSRVRRRRTAGLARPSTSQPRRPARPARSTSSTPFDAAQRLDHLLEVLQVADLDVTSIRACWSSSVCASMFLMFVLMSAIFALTAASSPFRSSTSIVSLTV